jgi:hypothetical protein
MPLPFEFDTLGSVRTILRAIGGAAALVVIPGLLYMLVIKRSVTGAAQIVGLGVLLASFGYVVFSRLGGSAGRITRDAVEVEPVAFYGFRMPGPAGRFPLRQFAAVRVERISRRIDTTPSTRRHERVWLVGRDGAPDILVARTAREAGVTLAHRLGETLDLPVETVESPH